MPTPRRIVEKNDIRVCFTWKIDRDQSDYMLLEKAMKGLGYNTENIRNPDAAEAAKILIRKGFELWLDPMMKESENKKKQ